MHILFRWRMILPMYAFFTLFFGWIAIHTSYFVYFNVDGLTVSTILSEGSSRLYTFITIVAWGMTIIGMPGLYCFAQGDAKYVKGTHIPLDKLNIHTYNNVTIITTKSENNFAYVFDHSPLGLDLKKQGYLEFTEYYDKNKKFKFSSLNTGHIVKMI